MEKKTILIVDDELGFPKMVKLYLEKTGDYNVICENNSMVAVETARSTRPDAVLLDLIMPGKDGAELKLDMEADPLLKDIPKLFLTSNVSQDDTDERGLVQTGDGLMLPKTTDPALVRQRVDDLVAGALA